VRSTQYSFRDRLADYFKRHPGQWIDGSVLEGIAGKYAWRTRISDCRTQLGMTIENRVRLVLTHEAGCPAFHRESVLSCCCDVSRSVRVSEYRYVPVLEAVPTQAHDLNAMTPNADEGRLW
jgi:hypothetical protein